MITVDHKKLGILYILYALFFLVVGGIEATIMRIQLIVPHNHFVSPEVFNRHVHHAWHHHDFLRRHAPRVRFRHLPGSADDWRARHGLSAAQCVELLDDRFRRAALYFSFIGGNGLYGAGSAPDVGWLAYAPLTAKAFSPGHSTDFWTLSLIVSGFGSIGTAINIITTILCMRCPGMTLGKMPLLAWLNLVLAGWCLSPSRRYRGADHADASTATLAGTSSTRRRAARRCCGCTSSGSSAIRRSTFLCCRRLHSCPRSFRCSRARRSSAIRSMVAATVGIGFVSLSVWAHHMFTVGMSSLRKHVLSRSPRWWSAFPPASRSSTGSATMWGGKIRFKTPMLFCIGFLFQFLIAGLTGIMLAARPSTGSSATPILWSRTFTTCIVGGILFTLFGAFYYWFPKMTGKNVQRNARQSGTSGCFLIGFHLTFDFMHIPGLLGMPRRIYTYEPGRGWDIWNLIVTIGVFFQAAGVLCLCRQSGLVLLQGQDAGNDPWDAWTLEWSTSSPPPEYNFATIPAVESRRPLWDIKHPEDPDWKYE